MSSVQGFLSSAQQRRLWSVQGEHAHYRVRCDVLLEGTLDAARLKAAVEAVAQRHEILRTSFRRQPGLAFPVQVVGSPVVHWREVDLGHRRPADHDDAVERECAAEHSRSMNVEQGPSLRAVLIRLSDSRHVLSIQAPSLCADDWSMQTLVRGVGDAYRRGGREGAAAGEPLQYADYAAWQDELLAADTDDRRAAQEHWRGVGQRLAARVMLPGQRTVADEASGGQQEVWPARVPVPLAPALAEPLRARTRASGTPMEIVLLAAWQVLLGRLSAAPHVVTAYWGDVRHYPDLEAAIGPFTRALPIPYDVDPDVPFAEVVAACQREVHTSLERHEFLRWEDLGQSGSAPGPLPFAFSYVKRPEVQDAGDISLAIRSELSVAEPFAVRLFCAQNADDELFVHVDYDPRALNPADAERLARQYELVLAAIAERAELRVGAIDLLAEADRRQLLVAFNDTAARRSDSCIHRLIAAQADRTPNAVAVVFEDQALTYAELDARANGVARRLRALGVRPEVPVAVSLDRSADMVVALLGVLKAGAPYVPLEPSLPAARFDLILAETGCPVIVTTKAQRDGMLLRRSHVVCVDDPDATGEPGAPEDLAGPANAAYVLFTSGSTGRPKGVTVEHRQLVDYVEGILERLDLPPGTSFAMISTFAADLGNTALFPALCSGGTLHVISAERAADAPRLADYFRRHQVDCLKIVPSHFAALLGSSADAAVVPRRCLIFGGEPLSWDLVRRVRELAPGCVVLNHYGPTETTVGVLAHTATSEPGDSRSSSATVPIGRPLGNTQVYLLDGHLQPVPYGVPGELFVGGHGLARGYHGHPALTAERFVPNPFGEPGTRLYRTGDVARHLTSNAIEFLGRRDHQVKIRGFRVELQEIEAVLCEHSSVDCAVVTVRDDAAAGRSLVAYVACAPEKNPGIAALRARLSERLPEYMVPGLFAFLDRLPLSSNGKIDRQALPDPAGLQAAPTATYVAPATDVERAVAAVWQDVLQVDRVGLSDNFFDLGGHSLFMVQVHGRLREIFVHHDLALMDLFRYPTVGALARHLNGGGQDARQPAAARGRQRAEMRRESHPRRETVINP